MTFRQFAFNNVRRNSRQYLSYFFSCMFSVTVFFVYAVLVFHPAVAQAEFREDIERGILLAEAIIFTFSFLFVLYSTGSFIKSRKKEYGLLMTLGASKHQLNKLLVLENTIIGLASIAAGILLGSLLAKLFLMIFSELLGLSDPLAFHLSYKAFLLTAGAYFIMFELNSLAVVWTLRTNSIIELFHGAKTPKKQPNFSWILSLAAIGLIGYAYYLAFTADLLLIFERMMPILAFILPGTYLLYTQASIGFSKLLQRNKSLYYKGTNLLTVSDLIYKLKDNSRLLFLVTILSAVAFTSSGALYGLYQSAEAEAEKYVPQDLSLISKGETNFETLNQTITRMEAEFDKRDIPYQSAYIEATQAEVSIPGNPGSTSWTQLLSYSDYLTLAELNDVTPAEALTNQEAYILLPEGYPEMETDFPAQRELTLDNHSGVFDVSTVPSMVNSNFFTTYIMVVPDQAYQQFISQADSNAVYGYYAMDIPAWTSYTEETKAAAAVAYQQSNREFSDRTVLIDSQAEFYINMKKTMSQTFFFGIFISILFFLAAGSILYFRLYQDIDKDLVHYRSLYRIGLTVKEMKAIATKELALLFFIPFLIAVVHASFAFKALQNMLSSSILLPSIVIIGSFLMVHGLYFLFIRRIYISKLQKVM